MVARTTPVTELLKTLIGREVTLRTGPQLANGPVSVRFDGATLRVIDASGLLFELHDCRQIAVQMPQFPLELFEAEEQAKS